uniref:Putative secreted peptide n=1 Tax=Anopheles braziliensis TaxID=58242 RepID=A0A2M3ZR97_9DIPT
MLHLLVALITLLSISISAPSFFRPGTIACVFQIVVSVSVKTYANLTFGESLSQCLFSSTLHTFTLHFHLILPQKQLR